MFVLFFSLSFTGNTTSLTLVNNGFLLAADAAPSANEGKVLQVVGGTPSWVSATSITGSVDISSNLTANSITSNGTLTVKGSTTLTTSLNGVVLAASGVISAGSASLANQVTGTLPVGRGGSGATTLTGVLIGNGASAFTTVTAPSGTIVGTTDIQTLTNKTINFSNNTVSMTITQLNAAVSDATLLTEGSINVVTNKTFTDNSTTFQDNTDTSKKMQFQLSQMSASTTVSITIPNISGTMLITGNTATITNKTINLANNTLVTTTDQLNSALSDGVLLTENSTNIGISSKTFNDNGITFQDNGDNSRKMQFQLSALSTATTASISIPPVTSGFMVLRNDVATLTNKSIDGASNTITNIDLTTSVTGTLPVANGGTGVTSKTGTGSVVLSANQTLTGVMTASTINATTLTLANSLAESEGGTGESTYSSGQILIGNGAGGLTKATISGTANEIEVTNGSGSITIGLPNIVSVTGLNASGRITASSLNVTGTAILGTISGPTGFSDGTAGNPGVNFTSDTNTGMYRDSADTLGFSVGGANQLLLDSTAFTITPAIVNQKSYDSGVGSGKAVYVSSLGLFGYLISTQKAKKDITNFNFDKAKFLELQPKTFKIKEEYGGDGTTQIGFIAEDAELLGLNYLVSKDSNGNVETFNYDKLPIYLMSVIRDQQEQIKSLTTRIEALEGK